jgi:hypothetical protein
MWGTFYGEPYTNIIGIFQQDEGVECGGTHLLLNQSNKRFHPDIEFIVNWLQGPI